MQPILYNLALGKEEPQYTPNIFKTVQMSTATVSIWTPSSALKRFRLMGYSIYLSDDATLASAGDTLLTLLDNATAIGIAYNFWLPASAITANAGGIAPIIVKFPGNGYLSTTANNALKATLSTYLATGTFSINVFGVEQ